MNRSPLIKAIIFDMDGLMLDTERIAQQAWRKASAEWGYTLTDEAYLSVVGRNVIDTETLFLQEFGEDFPFQPMYQRKQQHMYCLFEEDGIPTKPGLMPLLNFIDSHPLAKAVATSTVRSVAAKKLTTTGLISHFQTIVCGDEIDHGKPAPDIFLAAADKLAISPEFCLVLEDSEAGIAGAYAAGMTPVMVPDLKPPSLQAQQWAYAILSSLHEMPSLLSKLT